MEEKFTSPYSLPCRE